MLRYLVRDRGNVEHLLRAVASHLQWLVKALLQNRMFATRHNRLVVSYWMKKGLNKAAGLGVLVVVEKVSLILDRKDLAELVTFKKWNLM